LIFVYQKKGFQEYTRSTMRNDGQRVA
jgi:hypothetical protein